MAFNDDHKDPGAGLVTHHADSLIDAKLPADGTYFLFLGDAQQKGSKEHAYRLRISLPRPDFELLVAPSGINIGRGGTRVVTVHALRKDGFTGAIRLGLAGAPPGLSLSGARVPAVMDQVRMTLSASGAPGEAIRRVRLEGRAWVEGAEIVRTGAPADSLTQAFITTHQVRVQELLVASAGQRRQRRVPRILSPLPVRIPREGKVRVVVGVPAKSRRARIEFELSDAPNGISLVAATPAGRTTELQLQCDPSKVKLGLEGNLIVNVFVTPKSVEPADRKPGAKAKKTNKRRGGRRLMGVLPAIPFEIVARP